MPPVIFNEAKKKEKQKQLAKIPNFKSPVTTWELSDGIPNFWPKQLDSLHIHYARAFNKLIQGEETLDEWLIVGNTVLIWKSEDTQLPHRYRSITCLPTAYKCLTGILTEIIHNHLTQGGLLEAEQKGCKRGCYGTIDQLLLNKATQKLQHKKKKRY